MGAGAVNANLYFHNVWRLHLRTGSVFAWAQAHLLARRCWAVCTPFLFAAVHPVSMNYACWTDFAQRFHWSVIACELESTVASPRIQRRMTNPVLPWCSSAPSRNRAQRTICAIADFRYQLEMAVPSQHRETWAPCTPGTSTPGGLKIATH